MFTENPFNFDYSYLSLPDKFYSLTKASSLTAPNLYILNSQLCDDVNISPQEFKNWLPFIGNENMALQSFSQAYAGHQFGHFTLLGDGRAVILGEHITKNNNRFDIQIKGSGRTPYSRGGDGKATLKAMLREYLISESMFYLRIPTSRSLCVIKTGQTVHRETAHTGAALLRVMKSHIRVGTFEYAARFGKQDDVRALLHYTINRLYPAIVHDENPALCLLNTVIENQIELVTHWMRVGFIHGVMNTDNTAISGETFDYGPCAFMNIYNPNTVFSSIDYNGRYAFGNQYKIIAWNLVRFAESLLPVLDPNLKKSVELAQTALDGFEEMWREKYYTVMLKKIGIDCSNPELYFLIDELLSLMETQKMDYTNTFYDLSNSINDDEVQHINPTMKLWLEKWKNHIEHSSSTTHAKKVMQQNNPVIIPRNHLVEQALDDAIIGDLTLFESLLDALSKTYQYEHKRLEYMKSSNLAFEQSYQTFCGT